MAYNKGYHQQYYQKNRERILKYREEYCQKNKEKEKASQKRKYQRYKEKYKEISKKWRQENPEQAKERMKKWRKENPEKAKEASKKWRQENPEHHNEYQKIWQRQKSKTDSQFHLNKNIKTAIYRALKGRKAGRHWETLVGYTLQELKIHLENLFEPWMNWDNYGKWHIDHIKPQSLFKFKIAEDSEFKKCWALENLQPLWAKENLRKGNKFTF